MGEDLAMREDFLQMHFVEENAMIKYAGIIIPQLESDKEYTFPRGNFLTFLEGFAHIMWSPSAYYCGTCGG